MDRLRSTTQDPQRYKIIVNPEEQFSIVPYETRLTSGLREIGFVGTKEECATKIQSLRRG